MKHSLAWAGALIGALALLAAPGAQAQATNPSLTPGIPSIPSSGLIFPLNQSVTFQYTDPQGTGSITFVDLGLDQTTGFDRLQVRIIQNGITYNGSGIATPLPGAAAPFNNLVSFTVVSPAGIAYFFTGKMGLGVQFQGQGTYFPVSAPTQTYSWGLSGQATPPPATSLSLSIDRGCGSVYLRGQPMVISFRASANDTLTLTDQQLTSTYALFVNVPVIAGQTYSYSTFVGNAVGPRTLILSDPAGARAVCSFTGQ